MASMAFPASSNSQSCKSNGMPCTSSARRSSSAFCCNTARHEPSSSVSESSTRCEACWQARQLEKIAALARPQLPQIHSCLRWLAAGCFLPWLAAWLARCWGWAVWLAGWLAAYLAGSLAARRSSLNCSSQQAGCSKLLDWLAGLAEVAHWPAGWLALAFGRSSLCSSSQLEKSPNRSANASPCRRCGAISAGFAGGGKLAAAGSSSSSLTQRASRISAWLSVSGGTDGALWLPKVVVTVVSNTCSGTLMLLWLRLGCRCDCSCGCGCGYSHGRDCGCCGCDWL